MAIKAKIKRKPNKKLQDAIRKQVAPVLSVGVLNGAKDLNGEFIAIRAYYNEFGTYEKGVLNDKDTTSGIPARAPFRTTIKNKSEEWIKKVKQFVENLPADDPNRLVKAFEALGQIMQGDISQTIGSNLPPLLAINTILAKEAQGIADPERTLVEHGDFQKSISYQVDKN